MNRAGRTSAAVRVVALILLAEGFIWGLRSVPHFSCASEICRDPGSAGFVFTVVVMAGIFLAGLWWAWMVATGRSLKHDDREGAEAAPPVAPSSDGEEKRPEGST